LAHRGSTWQPLQGSAQQAFEACSPGGLARCIGDQILADLNLDVPQATPFRMYRDAVVGGIAHRVRGVVAHHQVAFRAQKIEHDLGKLRVAIVQHADLHRAGFTALDDAPSDVYGTLLAESFEPEAAVAGLGESYRIEQNYFKFHACCRMNHPALDAVMSLRAQHRFTGDEVASVHITSIPFGLRMLDTEPQSMLGAKFSIPYAVAAALVLGRTDTAAFEDRVLDDARIRAMTKRIEVAADDEMALKRADYPTAHVRIGLRDGRTLSQTTGVVRGDAANPVSSGEVVGKFLSLASGVLGDGRAHEIIEAVDTVDTLKDVRDLTALLAPL